MPRKVKPELFVIAKVVKSHGIKGTLKTTLETDFPERFKSLKLVWVGKSAETAIERRVIRAKGTPEYALIDLEGVSDRMASDALIGQFVFVPQENLFPLPPTLIYIHDLIGMSVSDESGGLLGRVTDVMKYPRSDYYEVELSSGDKKGKRFLVPANPQFILDVDRDQRNVTIRVMDGLFD
jgi:16S rRNA processing protein RimM